MKRISFGSLIIALTLLVSCRSEDAKMRATISNYLEATTTSAPNRAYMYISKADQNHQSVKAFTKSFAEMHSKPDAKFEILDLKKAGDRYKVDVQIDAKGVPSKEIYYLKKNLRGKYRVYLGLKSIDKIHNELDKARRLAADGAFDEAIGVVEQIASRPFRGSHPDKYEREINDVRNYLKKSAREKEFDRRIGKASLLKLDALKKEITALEKDLPMDVDALVNSFAKLKTTFQERFKKRAIKNYTFKNLRVKNVKDDWGIAKEVSFKAVNNTTRPLDSLRIELHLVNSKSQDLTESLKTIKLQIIPKGSTVDVDEEILTTKTIRRFPETWIGKRVKIVATDLHFASEENDK